jgi:sialate O-acetylesterase
MKRQILFALSIAVLLFSQSLDAKVTLPKMISDGLILQRDKPARIWGFADPQERVTVTFDGNNYYARADRKGNWLVLLPSTPWNGKTYTIKVNDIEIHNVVFGDVWVFSGQSNMQTPLERALDNYGDDILHYSNPLIREFLVGEKYAYDGPQKDFASGSWTEVTPETCLKMSMVPYFFARRIYETYQVPVAIIQCAVGGTAIESWMSPDNLKDYPQYARALEAQRNPQPRTGGPMGGFGNFAGFGGAGGAAPARPEVNPAYYETDFDDSEWAPAYLPHYFREVGITGSALIYYRHDLWLTAEQAASKNNLLKLGTITQSDETFINGVRVGTTGYEYPPRNYAFGEGILKEGKNVICIKINGASANGGFYEDEQYHLRLDRDTIALNDGWRFFKEDIPSNFNRPAGAPAQRPVVMQYKETAIRHNSNVRNPFGLYWGMLSPVTNANVKGVVWYQGETNSGNTPEYGSFLARMMTTWRKDFRDENLPVLIAQLPSHQAKTFLPVQDGWANVREGQRLATHMIKNAALAVGCDIGSWNNIHPTNKKIISERLAKGAMRIAYGESVVLSPECTKAELKDGRIYLTFSEIGNGLVVKGDEIRGFAVSDENGVYQRVNATIMGNKVVLYVAGIKNPQKVRYLWKNYVRDDVTLYNAEGMPASPFEIKL